MQLQQTIEMRGLRVITTKQLAEAYETDEKKLQYNFRYNKEKYQEGKHYIQVKGEELNTLKRRNEFQSFLKQVKHLYLWTEKGALLHAKSLNTDKAWEVYDYLVDFYFRKKETTKEVIIQNKYKEINPAKGMVVDVPENQEAQKLIQKVKKHLTGMEALLDLYDMYQREETYERIGKTIMDMAHKIDSDAFNLQCFKPKMIEKYL